MPSSNHFGEDKEPVEPFVGSLIQSISFKACLRKKLLGSFTESLYKDWYSEKSFKLGLTKLSTSNFIFFYFGIKLFYRANYY